MEDPWESIKSSRELLRILDDWNKTYYRALKDGNFDLADFCLTQVQTSVETPHGSLLRTNFSGLGDLPQQGWERLTRFNDTDHR